MAEESKKCALDEGKGGDIKDKKKSSVSNKIKELEDRISKTKYNKKTQFAIGTYKAQLAMLKEKQIAHASVGKKSQSYSIKKSGNATVAILGFPSVGKSTLLNALTNANSRVGSYDFTTLDVVPGVLEYRNAKIQILDVPGIVRGAAAGTGRGKEVLAAIRNADLIIMMIDVNQPKHYGYLMKEVYDSGIRLNTRSPDVKIVKTERNGVSISSTVKMTKLNHETIKSMLKEFRLSNAYVVIREDITDDQLIDILEGNRVYMPSVLVINKIDLASPEKIEEIKREFRPDIMISANRKIDTEPLKEIIFRKLRIINVFLKEVGREADMKEPLIMREGCTIEDVCVRLHKDFLEKFRFARVWGKSVKFPGQKVLKVSHKLMDGDILEMHLA